MKNTAVSKLMKYWGIYLKWYGKTGVRSYELQLRVVNYKLRVERLKARVEI